MCADRPKIGVAAIIVKDSKVLLGRRRGSHGEGDWCFPGGHLEFGETVEDCARREAMEEAGLDVQVTGRAPFTEDFFKKDSKHYVTLFVVAKVASGAVENREPQKCCGWEWFSWDALPSPLFLPIRNLLRTGFDPTKAESRKAFCLQPKR